MTQEEKQLLLKDLCARLPYYTELWSPVAGGNWAILTPVVVSNLMNADLNLPQIKSYLRPMSSMTEEEYLEFRKISGLRKDEEYFSNHLPEWGNSIITERVMVRTIDWLNAHQFDYRGLIPMGLALEATEGMYNLNNE